MNKDKTLLEEAQESEKWSYEHETSIFGFGGGWWLRFDGKKLWFRDDHFSEGEVRSIVDAHNHAAQGSEQEWTRKFVSDLYHRKGLGGIREAHNAAIEKATEQLQERLDISTDQQARMLRESRAAIEKAQANAYNDGWVAGREALRAAQASERRIPEQSSDNMSPAAQANEHLGEPAGDVTKSHHSGHVSHAAPASKRKYPIDMRTIVKENPDTPL